MLKMIPRCMPNSGSRAELRWVLTWERALTGALSHGQQPRSASHETRTAIASIDPCKARRKVPDLKLHEGTPIWPDGCRQMRASTCGASGRRLDAAQALGFRYELVKARALDVEMKPGNRRDEEFSRQHDGF